MDEVGLVADPSSERTRAGPNAPRPPVERQRGELPGVPRMPRRGRRGVRIGPRASVRRAVRAPKTGQLLLFRLKTGNDSRPVKLRFTVIHPAGGSHFRVVTTSTPAFTLPAHSPGVHTFLMKTRMFPMPIRRGSYLAVATPGVKPAAIHTRGRVTVYRQTFASWYGPGFIGGHTACGGTLSGGVLGVANKTLPCGTRVTFHYGSRTVTARVVDRGPYVAGREWDLTPAGKARLHFPSTGTVWSTK